jgi:hypothetical protein
LLLAVALFFKFSRFLSVRNLDVFALFAPTPGLLLLLESGGRKPWGYLALLCASGFLFVRCIVDLVLVRRPALTPNMNIAGLAWLGGALFLSLIAVAVRHPRETVDAGEAAATPIDEVRMHLMQQTSGPASGGADVRLWVERVLTLLCHLSVVVGLVLVGWRNFDDVHAGIAAATFYLLLPYTYMLMPGTRLGVGRWDHAWPMGLMVWAVLAYRRPTVAGLFLGLAAGSVFFPAVTFPVWLSFYWGRGARRFAIAFTASVGLCLGVVALLYLVNGELPQSLRTAWASAGWQAWKDLPAGTQGYWKGPTWGVHWAYRFPVFLAHATFVVTTLFWPTPKNLAHVLALSTASLIGLQFWYADQGGVHILWYLPFLLLMVFRPNLSNCVPPAPTDDWLARTGRYLTRRVLSVLRLPQPTTPVA